MTRTGFLAAALVLAGTGLAAAESVERGENLARRWCAGCHVIGPTTPGGDAGPSFESIAKRSLQDARKIKAAIAHPHPPMPDFDLTPTQYDDLAAYIMSLAK